MSSQNGIHPAVRVGHVHLHVSDMDRAKRFLVLGSESNYYTPGAKMSQDNAKTIIGLASDVRTSKELVDAIVEISTAGRAPQQHPDHTVAAGEPPHLAPLAVDHHRACLPEALLGPVLGAGIR